MAGHPGLLRAALCCAAVLRLLTTALSAQVQEFSAPGTNGNSHHGWSVSLSGETAVVGAPGRHDNSQGYAHVYRRVAGVWSETQILTGSTTGPTDWFGISVAIDGDLIAVGDWGESDGPSGTPGFHRGAAFVFRRGAPAAPFTEIARLQPADLAEHDRFGSAVALHGDVLAVSATGAADAGARSGAVYVFRRAAGAWTQEARLIAPVGAAEDRFGCAIALSGATLAVGAEGSDLAAPDAGAVFVYTFSGATWSLQATLSSTAAALDDRFGTALDVQGEVLAVGVPRRDVAGISNAGAVEVFRRTGASWNPEATLVSDAPVVLDNLGLSVACDGERVLAGLPEDDEAGAHAGAVLLFVQQAGLWSAPSKYVPADIDLSDRFGTSVALHGSLALVGAPKAYTTSPLRLGRVYMLGSVPEATP